MWLRSTGRPCEEVTTGSQAKQRSRAALQMINVWSCEQELVLGQEAVPEEINETGALPDLLRLLEVKGAIVTIDAAGCYSSVAEEITDAGADYAITLNT